MAERRWCLTGTPVQNKLDDLFSLTQFLRFHPLENHSNARKYILEPLGRQDKSAVTNLRLAMQTIALRRMKNASTSKRRDKIVIEIELSPRERQHYVSVRDRMRQLTLDSKTPQSHALLLCILYLRQLCSHGKPSLSPAPSRHMSENPHAGTPFCNKCGDLISVAATKFAQNVDLRKSQSSTETRILLHCFSNAVSVRNLLLPERRKEKN
jgi:SNF2 family DNA or RNA helicase